jgi:tetratricopeptide (TPR) repeat protein
MSRKRASLRTTPVLETAATPPDLKMPVLAWLAVSLLTFLVYLPAADGEFLNWDDNEYVSENPHIQRLDSRFLAWAFTSFHSLNWHPVTWISHALDYRLWGLQPWGHHLSSILLHAANTFLLGLLVFVLVRSAMATSMRALIVSCAAAALFGLHPLHVESVAWISERKDVLSTLFVLLSAILYLKHASSGRIGARGRHYFASLLFFVLALMSKPMPLALPLLLLVLDVYPLGRLAADGARPSWRGVLWEKVPFLAASAGSAIVTVLAQRAGGAMGSVEAYPLAARLGVALKAVVSYLIRSVYPFGLSPLYPYPRPGETSLLSVDVLAAATAFGAICVACVYFWRKGARLYLTAWACYLLLLLPVLGLVHFGPQASADRYTYVSIVPLFVLFGVGLERAAGRVWHRRPVLVIGIAALACLTVVLSVVTRTQIRVWRDSLTLWSRVVQLFPGSEVAYNRRGDAYLRLGKDDLALADLNRSIALSAQVFEASHFSRARILARLGRHREALADIDRVIAASPQRADAYNLRAGILEGLGRVPEAIADLSKAIALSPESAEYHDNRGMALRKAGDLGRALTDLDRSIALSPDQPETYNNRGLVRAAKGDLEGAISDFTTATKLDSGFGAAYLNRCEARRELGKLEDALADCSKGIELGGKTAAAYNARGLVLLRMGRLSSAKDDFQKAVAAVPEGAEAYLNRATVLRAEGDWNAALADYSKAIELDGRFLEAYNHRGTLLGERGRNDEAIRDFDRIIEMDPASASAYLNRGVAKYNSGKRAEAIVDFKAAARLGDRRIQARLAKMGIWW